MSVASQIRVLIIDGQTPARRQSQPKTGVNNSLAKPYIVAKLREVLEKVFGAIKS